MRASFILSLAQVKSTQLAKPVSSSRTRRLLSRVGGSCGGLIAGLVGGLWLLSLVFWASACLGGPTLEASHPGYSQANCLSAGCHQVEQLGPIHPHATRPPECVGCHGGNGACEPVDSPRFTHSLGEGCVVCHQEMHDFTSAEDCRACHFAPVGTRDCQP